MHGVGVFMSANVLSWEIQEAGVRARDTVQKGGTPQRKEMVGIGVLATVCAATTRCLSAAESFHSFNLFPAPN